ncbi:ATP-grasp domain-containing protein [Vibrio campbellii]|uniref:ATP-grasp domain-containing protein n=1 Tax=Vibrio campbellii TaxID=680 RepID=A0ABY5ICS0_9VIBR|nr:ATP-grasp domain-containing protein [Vibrio campbellii]UTZ20571.1 ATP-grasp domain-containing protein [Vibrio campbellii]UTZ32075.1 ATP-grasp domain-containing protein [Vibrio campbellii]
MNILLTSVGRRTYLVNYFKDALKPHNGQVFAANSIETYALKQADGFTITPPIYSEGYIDYLVNYCLKHDIQAIISLFDVDLPILSKHKCEFERNGIRVVVSDESVIEICNDKWKTYQFLISHNIATPKTYLSLKNAHDDIENLSFPLIVKPRWGMGSIGIYKADNMDELSIFYKKVTNEIKSSYLKYESESDIEQSVLIQQCISGPEYGIEVINDLDKNYVTTLCKQKLAMRSGETDQAITLNSEKLEAIGKRLSESLGHIAVLDTDCLEQDGQYYVLEMNARFGGQYPFSHLAGADIPKQIVEWLVGNGTKQEFVEIDNAVVVSKDLTPVIL